MKHEFRGSVSLLALMCVVSGFAAPFPLSDTTSDLDEETLQEVIQEAQANDVDVTTQNALLYKGLMLFQEEEYEEAIQFLEAALRMDPSLTAGIEALGWAYIRTDRPERGYALWEYFKTLMPDHWMPYNLLAQVAVMKQDWHQADAMFRKTLELNPELYDQRYWFAQNLLRLGKTTEGEQVLRDLVALEPGRLDIQIDLANVLTYRFEYEESAKIWRHINSELPDNPQFMMNEAELELRIGEIKIADRICADVLAMEDIMENFPEQASRAMNLRVDLAELQDSSGKSIDRLGEMIDQTEDPRIRSYLRLRQANRYRLLFESDPKAYPLRRLLEMEREAIREDPYSIEPRLLYAETCIIAKHYYAAERQAKYILERFNRYNIRAKDVLFEVALAQHRFDDAEQILIDRFTTSDVSGPERHVQLARVKMARGDYQEALEELDTMESAAQRGTVLTLLYHGLTESDWVALTSARRLREHVNALQNAGFVFISPTDIPKYAGLREGQSAVEAPRRMPWLARTIDNLIYQVSGFRRFRPEDNRDFRDEKPMKYVAMTFDDGLRSSIMLGSEAAEAAGAPFGMFVITRPQKDYQPSVAGWKEFQDAAKSGLWVIGSHLYEAHYAGPVDKDGKDIRMFLPNRLWLPAKNRIESMNEWDVRMRKEFTQSLEIMEKEMGEYKAPVRMCAYPTGDIGQEATCNLVGLKNPLKSILAEASRSFQIGFVQSQIGYTTVGDPLITARRYEPRWNDEGSDVVRAVYENHPVFIARRTRVELAMLMNKPNMAEKMLKLLRRDGYPEELCRKMEKEVRRHFRNIQFQEERPMTKLMEQQAFAGMEGDDGQLRDPTFDPFDPDLDPDIAAQMKKDLGYDVAATSDNPAVTSASEDDSKKSKVDLGDESPLFKIDNPSIHGEVEDTKAIDQFELQRYGARFGLDLNPNSSLSAEIFLTSIDQTVRPRWNAVTNDMTKVLYREFEAERTDVIFRYSHRYRHSGATLSLAFGMAQLDLNHTDENTADLEDEVGTEEFWREDGDSEFVYEIGFQWHPRTTMSLNVLYSHNLVQTAVKMIDYDSLLGDWQWKPFDNLELEARAQYFAYSDDNALYVMQGNALFEVMPDMGVHMGVEGYVASASHGCDYYWTPYWDQRVSYLVRYQKVHQGYSFYIDFLAGVQREDARPLRRRQDDGLSSSTDWGYVWGFRGKYHHLLNDVLTLDIEANVGALRDYVDHRLVIGLTATF